MPVSPLLLRQFPQFSDWPDDSLAELAEKMELRRLTRRQVLLNCEDRSSSLAWVIEGTVWLVDHSLDDRECVLGRYGPGEILGELHAFGGASELPSNLGYVAASASSVATVATTFMQQLIASTPAIACHVIQLMAKRSCAHFRWRSILALPSAVERVMAVLESLSRDQASPRQCLPAGITQQEIAAYANTTRETVTRTMQRLQASGAVIRDGSHWLIDLAALHAARQEISPG